ncbi:MAG: DNA repair protein RecO [Halanaerobiales bacterium]
MAIIETESVVLKQYDLGESDKIITFYTKDYGKIRAIAKGVRKGNNRFSGIVLPFSYNLLTVYKGRSLDRINQLNNIFSFSKLREDLTKMAFASFMAEIIEKVGLENNPNQALFSLLLASFYRILKKEEKDIKYIELAFKILIMGILGFKPVLKQCVLCNNEVVYSNRNLLAVEYGGLICNNCIKDEYKYNKENVFLRGESLKIMNIILERGFAPLDKLIISKSAYVELDKAINNFLFYHLDLNLKSLDFLNMIKNLG